MSISLPIDIPIWKMKKDVGEENSVDTATVLTGFVREKYLKHLKTLLLKNYSSCSQQNPLRILTEQDIEKCARDLENEALRDCMVVQLYQKSMSSTVKDIKGHTDLLKLHNIFENFTFSSANKETQTETIAIEKTPTQPLPDLIGRFEMSEAVQCKKEPPEEPPTVTQLSMDLQFDTSKIKKESPLNDDLLNTFTPSERVSTNFKERQTVKQRQSPKVKLCNATNSNKVHNKLEQSAPYQEHGSVQSEPLTNDSEYLSLDERLANILGLQEDNISSAGSTLELDKMLSGPTSDFKELDFPYLDERLAEIFGETTEQEPEVKRKRYIKKVTSWRSEKETNLRMLNSLMTRFSKIKKQQVERLFFELFEPRRRRRRKVAPTSNAVAGSMVSNLVSEKKLLGRRVVQHLMRFYKSGKISSREQFKYAASQITDGLILRSIVPEESEIEESIQNFFIMNSTVKK